MSLRQLRRFIRKQVVRIILWGSVFVIFVIGTFVSFGTVKRGPAEARPPSVVAEVNRWQITRADFNKQLRDYAATVNPSVKTWIPTKYYLLDRLIDDILLQQAARKHRIRVSRKEIHARIDEMVDERLKRYQKEFRNNKEFRDWVRREFGSLNRFRRELKDRFLDLRDSIAQDILHEKLRKLVESDVKVTEADLRREHRKVRLRHILVSFLV
ncbi:MAG TPA: hypothetical protein EYP10_11540 [Armatimonadetes bacterium]|nr:hypothetical protein [Armatimonadota bacterium]